MQTRVSLKKVSEKVLKRPEPETNKEDGNINI
jgi:hypothetical protein